jgi:hypothetical protein
MKISNQIRLRNITQKFQTMAVDSKTFYRIQVVLYFVSLLPLTRLYISAKGHISAVQSVHVSP